MTTPLSRVLSLSLAAGTALVVSLCWLPGAGPAFAAAGPASPAGQPADAAALGGYNVLIADRGNNRVLLVSPDKKILWEYDFAGLARSTGADDAFFADGGKSVIVSLEHQQVVQIIDIASKQVTWQYGVFGKRGSRDGLLNFPDDAYRLPNGDISVADIRNCRILEIAPDKTIVRQAGLTDRCGSQAPLLASPNGDTPLADGHMLISTIRDHSMTELDAAWKPMLKLSLPVRYPSDPQLTKAGNFLVASYTHPGRIIEIDRAGSVVWDYAAADAGQLNRPSLAIELPNGNIMANDDLNQRVIVVDKASKTILWQYGVTGHRGSAPGYLAIPDGLDIIPGSAGAAPATTGPGKAATMADARSPLKSAFLAAAVVAAPRFPRRAAPVVNKVGAVTRHAARFVGQEVAMRGYLLARENGYILFSDEPGGRIGRFDLPVTGTGIDQIVPRRALPYRGHVPRPRPDCEQRQSGSSGADQPPQPAVP